MLCRPPSRGTTPFAFPRSSSMRDFAFRSPRFSSNSSTTPRFHRLWSTPTLSGYWWAAASWICCLTWTCLCWRSYSPTPSRKNRMISTAWLPAFHHFIWWPAFLTRPRGPPKDTCWSRAHGRAWRCTRTSSSLPTSHWRPQVWISCPLSSYGCNLDKHHKVANMLYSLGCRQG